MEGRPLTPMEKLLLSTQKKRSGEGDKAVNRKKGINVIGSNNVPPVRTLETEGVTGVRANS